jgi:hypothetical protein
MWQKLRKAAGGRFRKTEGTVDRALAMVSLLDSVVRTSQNVDGTVTIYVRGEVDDHYHDIVQLLRANAPGLHGQICRAVETPPLARPQASVKQADLLQ